MFIMFISLGEFIKIKVLGFINVKIFEEKSFSEDIYRCYRVFICYIINRKKFVLVIEFNYYGDFIIS